MTKRRASGSLGTADRDLPQPREIDREERQDRAELDQDGEGLVGLAFEAEEVLQEQEMAGRGDRQELGAALERRRGSPPGPARSTPSRAPCPATRDAPDRESGCRIGLSCRRGFYTAARFGRHQSAKAFPDGYQPLRATPVLIRPARSGPSPARAREPSMAILHHYPFCPNSRFVRLVLAEIGLEPELQEERPWERRTEYLALNPAGIDAGPRRRRGRRARRRGHRRISRRDARRSGSTAAGCCPKEPADRVEVRRLLDWFLGKFQRGGHRPSRHREDLQALHGAGGAAARRT